MGFRASMMNIGRSVQINRKNIEKEQEEKQKKDIKNKENKVTNIYETSSGKIKKSADKYKGEIDKSKAKAQQVASKSEKLADKGAKIAGATSMAMQVKAMERGDEIGKQMEAMKKERDAIQKENEKVIDKKMAEASKLSKWYERLTTDYDKYLKRQKDEMMTVEKEMDQKRAEQQQNYGASSLLLQRSSQLAGRGMAASGASDAVRQATVMRQAGEDYTQAMERIDSIEQQKKQIAASLAQSATASEMQGITSGASIMAQEIGQKSAALSEGIQGRTQRWAQSFGLELQGTGQASSIEQQALQSTAGIMGQATGMQMQAQQTGMQAVAMEQGLIGDQFKLDTLAPQLAMEESQREREYELQKQGLSVASRPTPNVSGGIGSKLSGALMMGASGAAIGSAIPGIGTGIGAGVGFVAGLATL